MLLPTQKVFWKVDDREITNNLAKFGTLKGPIRRKTYPERSLKGLENGSITALITLSHPLPSYHYLRGKKFEAYYKGMTKTGYWCLEPGNKCKYFNMGNGNACRKSGAIKGNFKQYLSNLLTDIGWKTDENIDSNESNEQPNSNTD